jgi:hypothetical protein
LLRRDGAAHYDSMTLETQKRVGHLTFDWFWTWANNLDNYEELEGGYGTLYANNGAFADENPYAPLLWNHDHVTPHHRVVLNTTWDLPVGRGRRFGANLAGPLEQAIGGWSLYWVGFFQTGQWFTPTFSTADPANTNSIGGLPDRIGDGNLPPGQRTVDHWFDTSAFKIPGCPDANPICSSPSITPANVGRYGNSGINILEGPGLNSQNLSLRKRFQLNERWHLDVMAMCGNLFNHPNFLPPPAIIDASDPAVINGQHDRFFSAEKSGPRVIEGRFRLEF